MNDPYVYPDTNVLINKLNIRDNNALSAAESTICRNAMLNGMPQGDFNFQHLQSIHKALFGELYSFAGEVRTITIYKGDSMFCSHDYIESESNKLFTKLHNEQFLENCPNESVLISRISHYFAEINAIHPFREGNGRANREFISQLASHNNLELDFTKINRAEYLQASIDSFNGDNLLLQNILMSCSSRKPLGLIKTNEDVLKYYENISPNLITKIREDGFLKDGQVTKLHVNHKIDSFNTTPQRLAIALEKQTGHKIQAQFDKSLAISKEFDLSL